MGQKGLVNTIVPLRGGIRPHHIKFVPIVCPFPPALIPQWQMHFYSRTCSVDVNLKSLIGLE